MRSELYTQLKTIFSSSSVNGIQKCTDVDSPPSLDGQSDKSFAIPQRDIVFSRMSFQCLFRSANNNYGGVPFTLLRQNPLNTLPAHVARSCGTPDNTTNATAANSKHKKWTPL
jgi:hypothetical protein